MTEEVEEVEPLEWFFTNYKWFGYNPKEPASEQFERLCRLAGWKKGDPQYEKAQQGYNTAVAAQSNSSAGSDDNDLGAGHVLLAHVGIPHFPDSVEECKSVDEKWRTYRDSPEVVTEEEEEEEKQEKQEKEKKIEPLERFFTSYKWFRYNPKESVSEQWARLRRQGGWKRGDPKGEEAWQGYRTALVTQFNVSYGRDDNNLDAWHALLAHIGITELPESIEECKNVSENR